MNDFDKEVRHILLEKLKEMAEIEPGDCIDRGDYATVCNVMNDIAKTLLDE